MPAKKRCAVVGAANIDIGGFPRGRVTLQDSNPGRIVLSAGGVGRNIACNLARLGVETHLVAPLGTDAFADIVRSDCARAGVDTGLCYTFPGAASSSYLYIADLNGDMQMAVNDMDICLRMTPEALSDRLDALNAMDAVVLDANLPEETIAWLAAQVRAPLTADAVSAAKARRLLGALPGLRMLKPNALEAEVLTGLPVHDPASAEAAARRLVAMGVRQVCITLGERGACCADSSGVQYLPCMPVQLTNATGAGDAFTAALVWAGLDGRSLIDAVRAGMAAAALTVESEQTVNPELSEQALLKRMARMDAPGANS